MEYVPELETDRLRLRAHRIDDLDACVAMWSDPKVTRFIGGTPSSEQRTWARLLAYAGHWALMRFGYWLAEDKQSGAFMGEVGFGDFRRDIDPRMRRVPEIGWAFSARVHGRGYATEAVRAVVSWGDAHLESVRTVCLIHPDNRASLRIARKCGYQELGRKFLNDGPVVLLERLAGNDNRAET